MKERRALAKKCMSISVCTTSHSSTCWYNINSIYFVCWCVCFLSNKLNLTSLVFLCCCLCVALSISFPLPCLYVCTCNFAFYIICLYLFAFLCLFIAILILIHITWSWCDSFMSHILYYVYIYKAFWSHCYYFALYFVQYYLHIQMRLCVSLLACFSLWAAILMCNSCRWSWWLYIHTCRWHVAVDVQFELISA
jgi:hypothetical protein